jgi:hypothetical protein
LSFGFGNSEFGDQELGGAARMLKPNGVDQILFSIKRTVPSMKKVLRLIFDLLINFIFDLLKAEIDKVATKGKLA